MSLPTFLPSFALISSSVLFLAGCSWLPSKSEAPKTTDILVRTSPRGADCSIVGTNGFQADIIAPSYLTIPNDDSPLRVTCTLMNYRPAHGTVVITPKGWLSETTDSISEIGVDSLSLLGLDKGDPAKKDKTVQVFKVDLKPISPQVLKYSE